MKKERLFVFLENLSKGKFSKWCAESVIVVTEPNGQGISYVHRTLYKPTLGLTVSHVMRTPWPL